MSIIEFLHDIVVIIWKIWNVTFSIKVVHPLDDLKVVGLLCFFYVYIF